MTKRALFLLRAGPLPADQLALSLGISRVHLHTVINRARGQVVRVDGSPRCGRFAKPVYGLHQP